MQITKPDVISKRDFKKTEIENIFTDKEKQELAIVNKDHAIVISEDDDLKDSGEID